MLLCVCVWDVAPGLPQGSVGTAPSVGHSRHSSSLSATSRGSVELASFDSDRTVHSLLRDYGKSDRFSEEAGYCSLMNMVGIVVYVLI